MAETCKVCLDSTCRFDPASLTILHRLNDLEELLRAKTVTIVAHDQNGRQASPLLSIPENAGGYLFREACGMETVLYQHLIIPLHQTPPLT